MMRVAWAFLSKDLRDALRSQSLLVILLGPVLLAAFFVGAMDRGQAPQLSIGVTGDLNSGLVNALESSGMCQLRISADEQALRRAVQNRELVLSVQIPPHFDEDLRQDLFPVLELYLDESSWAKAMAARELVRTALRQMAGQEVPADIRVERAHAAEGGVALAFLPLWMLFASLAALSVTSSTLVEEREQRTMEAVLLAPVGWLEILGGKIASGTILASVATLLVVVVSYRGEVQWGPLLLLIVMGSLIMALVGLILGMWVKSQTACGVWNSLAYLALLMPVSMADYNQSAGALAQWLPSWYLSQGFNQALLAGGGWRAVSGDLGILTLFVLLGLGLGAYSFRCWRSRL